MTLQNEKISSILKFADPVIASILDKALSEKEISAKDALLLFDAKGIDFHLVGMVADTLRKRRVGDAVTYVVNRNINFTNVCIKQCGFCAFSRDFREEDGISYQLKRFLEGQKKHIIMVRQKSVFRLDFHQIWISTFMKIFVEG